MDNVFDVEVNSNAIAIPDNDLPIPEGGGSLSGKKIRPVIVKLLYTAGLFEIPALNSEKLPKLVGPIFGIQPAGEARALKRNYLTAFDANNIQPPVCASLDGYSGSRKSMTVKEAMDQGIQGLKNAPPEIYNKRVFGDCGRCFFGQFRSAGVHRGEPRAGKQCGDYSLYGIMLGMNPDGTGGMPVVLQASSVGAGLLESIVRIVEAKGGYLEWYNWTILPTGGGKNQKSMAVVFSGLLQKEGVQRVFELKRNYEPILAEMAERFVNGESMDSEGLNDRERGETHNIPF